MSVKRTEGRGGKPGADDDMSRLTCLPTGVFTPTDIDHILRRDGGYWTIVFEV